jgi:copper transport protein
MIPARRLVAAAAAATSVVVAVLALSSAPAGAHASLESSDPADGAVLDEAPSAVTFTFNEGVRVSTGGMRVVDQDNERVDTGEVASEGQTATVELEADLPDGVYTAAFRIISADGHPIRGGIVFQVGEDVEASAVSLDDVLGSSDRGWEVSAAVLRGFAYVGALLAAGGAAFLVLVHDGGPGRERLVRLVTIGAVVGIVALLLALPVQAALATGLGLGSITEDGVLGDVLAEGVGLATAVTVFGLLDLVVALRLLRPGSAQRAVVLVAAVLAAGGFALSGHTRADDAAWWMVSADLAHGIAAAAWFGGLVLLALTLRRRHADGEAAASAGVLARFSWLATGAVVVAGVTGSLLAYSEVRALSALDTTYGAVLVAKLALLIPIALVACWNHWTLLPRVEQEEDAGERVHALGRVRRAVWVEAVGLVLVLAVTAVLVNVTPARTAAGITGIYSDTQAIGEEHEVNLVVDPNQAGSNDVHLYFFDDSGAPLVDETFASVALRLTPPGGELGTIEREPTFIAPGHYTLSGNELSIAGQWGIEVEVRIGEFGLSTADFPVKVNP